MSEPTIPFQFVREQKNPIHVGMITTIQNAINDGAKKPQNRNLLFLILLLSVLSKQRILPLFEFPGQKLYPGNLFNSYQLFCCFLNSLHCSIQVFVTSSQSASPARYFCRCIRILGNSQQGNRCAESCCKRLHQLDVHRFGRTENCCE